MHTAQPQRGLLRYVRTYVLEEATGFNLLTTLEMRWKGDAILITNPFTPNQPRPQILNCTSHMYNTQNNYYTVHKAVVSIPTP